ncbi:hypothetical protein [Alkalihalobacillus sp. R86527]|uniref:hypothetical protein n=1 Tax=Alkalihalobacillus sp. R86527 TaxID=3093863 RepID=UPI00366D57E1
MEDLLKLSIEKVMNELLADPDSIIYGELNRGIEKSVENNITPIDYYYFLKLSDGARCGAIDIWSYEELPSHQFRVSDFSGGHEKWIEVGQVLFEPLVIHKESEAVYLYQSEQLLKVADNFEEFILTFAFGDKYEELIPDSYFDEWFLLLKRLDLA